MLKRNTSDWRFRTVYVLTVEGAIVQLAMLIGILAVAYFGGYEVGSYKATMAHCEAVQCLDK